MPLLNLQFSQMRSSFGTAATSETKLENLASSMVSLQIIAAYLMMTERLDPAEAICLVKRMKHDIQPNDGFQQQLQLWQVIPK